MVVTLNPYKLQCGICKQPFHNDDIVAIVDHPNGPGQHVAVHAYHHGVARLVQYPSQLVARATLNHVARSVREGFSVEEAICVLNEEMAEIEKVRNE